MNIQRKTIPVEVNGEKYEMVLDFQAAILFEDLYGMSIFEGMEQLSNGINLKVLAYLIASCLKDKEGNCVGVDFVNKIDLFDGMEYFLDKLTQLADNSLDKETNESKKVVKKKTKK